MYISSWPGLTPGGFLRRRREADLPYPLNQPNRLSFCVARSGIYHLFRALRLDPKDMVLVPDYHSGNEVSAIHAAGASIAYYPILRNLEPDVDTLARLIRGGARVVYVIHYLGWPQPMKEIQKLCREHGCILIEDCALSLLSEAGGAPLGASGDYSIFCLYKTLPVPNGGVLVQNRNLLRELGGLELEQCPRTTAIGRTAELGLEALRSRLDLTGKVLFGIKRTFGRLVRAAKVRQVPVGNIGWELGDVKVAMSSICDAVMRGLDYEAIRRRRRENFLALRERLQGRVKLLREDLGEGVCPLFFPILVRDKHSAASALWRRGIGAVEFWNDDHPLAAPHRGADAKYLRTHVLELPLHQDVTPRQTDYIAGQVLELGLQAAS